MKKIGNLCRIDTLGRIVIPIGLRRMLDLNANDALEISTDESDNIILSRYIPVCVFCGSEDDLTDYKSKHICKKCRDDIGAKE